MKILKWMKDGGPESRVWGFFLIEWKRFFSVAVLMFKDGSREAYHTHAFNAISWVLRGALSEDCLLEKTSQSEKHQFNNYFPSLKPIWTPRTNRHRVTSRGTTWVLSFRGPWAEYWTEYLPAEDRFITLTNGRKEIDFYEEYARDLGITRAEAKQRILASMFGLGLEK